MKTVTCSNCGKTYKQNEDKGTTIAIVVGRDADKPLCYNCALDRVTAGNPPEEGDFNAAMLISGEMTDTDWNNLQEDWRSIEEGTPTNYGSIFLEEYDDPAWCDRCNCDIAFCNLCYYCYEHTEDCKCTCALCGTPHVQAHLCNNCEAKWDKAIQGKIPATALYISNCSVCRIPFHNELQWHYHYDDKEGMQETTTRQEKCLRCR